MFDVTVWRHLAINGESGAAYTISVAMFSLRSISVELVHDYVYIYYSFFVSILCSAARLQISASSLSIRASYKYNCFLILSGVWVSELLLCVWLVTDSCVINCSGNLWWPRRTIAF